MAKTGQKRTLRISYSEVVDTMALISWDCGFLYRITLSVSLSWPSGSSEAVVVNFDQILGF